MLWCVPTCAPLCNLTTTLHRDVLAELTSVGKPPVPCAGMSFGHEYDDQDHGMANDTGQPISAEEMLRMMFKSPILQNTFASPTQEPEYPTPYAPQEYFMGGIAAGGEIPPIDADIFAASAWRASDGPFCVDQVPNATAMIADLWVNEPTGLECV